MAEEISLEEFAGGLDDSVEIIEFLAPAISLWSESACWAGYSAPHTFWRSEISLMDEAGLVGDPLVVIGHVDFLMVPTGFGDICAELDSISTYTDWTVNRFSPLFKEGSVDPGIDLRFDGSTEVALLVVNACVHDLFRGHHLGAWAVATTIMTMMPVSTGLAALCPHSEDLGGGEISADSAAAVSRFNRYWERIGFRPLPDHPEILALATGAPDQVAAFETLHKRFFPEDDDVAAETVHVAAGALKRAFQRAAK
ncbi:hypothetical protein [Mycolicibacterium peregrinum]|uniref:hypothetical protein n=1 Tax=Mycolicibacterium peregrinum TaxID=43304 RepID=UPI001056CBC7|nr:hypothetical protein [Mycolicibacterium peregrinum]